MNRAQADAIITAQRFIEDGCLILDTETTGLDDHAQIIEIAIIDQTGKTLIDELIRPSSPIPAEVTAIHKITDQMVESCPIWPERWPTIRETLNEQRVLAYNSEFDLRLIQQSCDKYKLQIPAGRWDTVGMGTRWGCLMMLYMQFTGSERRISLAKACEQTGIRPASHRALEDAQTALRLLHHIANA